jgi:hypothetical protein
MQGKGEPSLAEKEVTLFGVTSSIKQDLISRNAYRVISKFGYLLSAG